jgi:UDPglucose 6-dehydrogenase
VRVAVIGTGHVGLVTCAALAEMGHEVAGMDSDSDKIELLSKGSVPFYEPGLDELLEKHTAAGSLRFTRREEEALPQADVVFICVGTPPLANGGASLLAVEKAGRMVAQHGKDGVVIVEKSTVPAGTAERLQLTLTRERPGLRFEVVSNPEFLREGSAVQDSLHPDRILIGAESYRASQVMRRIYRPLIRSGCRFIETDIPTAELAKHACNAFLSLKISFANALAEICELAGADVVSVADVMGSDHRIGRSFLDAGLGFGGFCFPKDLAAFERLAAGLGYDFPLLREVARINERAVDSVVAKVRDALWNLEEKRIALLGLAFKGGTDDTRLSPALAVARRLLAEGAAVIGYDPQAGPAAKADLPELEVAGDPYEAAWGAHCLVVCTDWDAFRGLDLAALREVMLYPVVVDGRNIFDPAVMGKLGFTYYPTGRPPIIPSTRRAAGPGHPRRPAAGAVSPTARRPLLPDGEWAAERVAGRSARRLKRAFDA